MNFKRLNCAGIIAGTLLFAASGFAYSADFADADIQRLAAQKVWQHLVFLHRDRPEIRTEGFYLSGKKHATPEKELRATLAEFENNPQAKCKFPARYYWLSTQLPDDYLQQGLEDCAQMPKVIKNFSLLLVSGYLKNPVSTFGHVLITTQPLDENRLLADAYNFGATVPSSDNGLVYATKGVLGLYPAVFGKWDYFRNDAHYSTVENRDIWEYQLDLNEIERSILTYHLHELTEFQFDYYFFKQNCAYRTGELLEFIEGMKVTHRKSPWYSPDYIASQLVEFDQNQERKLVKNEIFRPSQQTKVLSHFNDLTQDVRVVVQDVIATHQLEKLSTLGPKDLDTAIHFLLDYSALKQKSDPNNKRYIDLRNALIRMRIAQPVIDHELPYTTIYRQSPAHGPKPTRLGVQAGTVNGIDFNMYYRDPLNEGTDINMRFSAIDFSYKHIEGNDQIAATVIDVSKFSHLVNTLPEEQRWSWQGKVGLQSDPFDGDHVQHFAEGGIGAAFISQNNWLAYHFFGAALHDQDHHIDLKTNTGLIYKSAKVSGQIEYENRFRESDRWQKYSLILRKKVEKNTDIRLHWFKQSETPAQTSVGLNFYW